MTTPERLIEILANKKTLPASWRQAVATVDRGLFVPGTIEVDDRTIHRSDGSDEWARAVYGDLSLITQINDGRPTGEDAYRLPTSSSSMPTVMLEMLDALDVRPGHRVLEIGTGTGYNAALLCRRLGDESVTSIEVDPDVAATARRNLEAAGSSPRLVVGDGLAGHAQGGPYDRIIATCTVRDIPFAWIEQLAPEGRLITLWGSSYFAYSYASLTATRRGEATGRLWGRPAFMWLRGHRSGAGLLRECLHHRDQATVRRTRLSPYDVEDLDPRFAVSLSVRDAWPLLCTAEDGSDEATLWVISDDHASWAAVEYVPGQTDFGVRQYGPRSVWNEVERAFASWEGAENPGRERFGLTVDTNGQHLWLDSPDRPWNPPSD
ncbi:methyltransferase domain-containing protein [Streptomyces sp. PTM05]|uniref:Protein-L-isoaspartate O-methyltransferase n=1 Tax=Streptantibioticus parmotrematis TaxID=2873249 RepID=A0ABS7QNZ8_9ACTN|nr:methyltransferase domain-containing protein [Streptantibioticus parmotrematis]MBY8884903.1 methyltransferase domain-containing protein [Streptantibioticus parmotrematis]